MKRLVSSLTLLSLFTAAAEAQIAPTGVWNPAPPAAVTYGGTGLNGPSQQTSILTNVDLFMSATARCSGTGSAFACNAPLTNDAAGTFTAQSGNDQSGIPLAGGATWNWNYAIIGSDANLYKYAIFYDLNNSVGTAEAGLFQSDFFSVASNTVPFQNSVNNVFSFLNPGQNPPAGPPIFNANNVGQYTFVLAAYDQTATSRSLTDNTGLRGFVSMNVNVVPEPSTYLLMGSGLVGVFFAARRRRNA